MENLQIVQCNLQIGWPFYQFADWPGQFANWPDWQIGRNRYTYRSQSEDIVLKRFLFERVVVVNCIFEPCVGVEYL